MMRRIAFVLSAGAVMAALLVVIAAPAMAQNRNHNNNNDHVRHFNNNDDFFVIRDDFDNDDFFDHRFFDNDFGQDFDQEAESGDVDLSFESTNAGDNSNVAAPALQFANTGNLQNEQGFSSFGSSVDDVDFEGGELVFEPSLGTDVDQAVGQSSTASSDWSWW